ncbi:MAG: cbb3-type cytochrome c oxidase subunit 3 [Pseudomonadales bacterium]|nr:cbb3-type cytochrome c oxidase subunit 3 [Pseudomonadales bacterium]MCP5330449.1 cbb3-type cytochrome c oxidase subunit 3 [Pseudomonadales bacterium]MCP5343938.1 cbb3-type cytochrome c oxidase subunit 3 [Pseudomonadales bacterium]
MDMTDLRSLATVLCAIGFATVVWWAYGPSRKQRFEEDAQLPFLESDDEAYHPASGNLRNRGEES